ncbi:hypothetical protein C3Y08_25180 [Burkholderia gladioli]|uniref:hypothetical protein n=1 Tax=Burkholderia gladioli TaxID=28095 RepID=UPI000CDA6A2F|nr:hypothetical protein [Burkholderia gladioli]POS05317.1 hypothetical protein C3Y08_25180 [Burkholderia gladioli]
MAKLGQRAFARHINVSLRAVQKAIQSGRIVVDGDGKIDSDTETAAWRRNTDDSRRSMTDQARQNAVNRASDDFPSAPDDDEVDGDEIDGQPAAATREDPSLATYRDARARREMVRLERDQLELARERGTTLARDLAERLAFTAFRTVRDNIMNVPVRIKDVLAAETDPTRVEQLLEEELTQALASVDAEALLRDTDEEEADGGDRILSEKDYGGDSA